MTGITRNLVNEKLDIRLEEGSMEELNVFMYLEVNMFVNGSLKDKVSHRIGEWGNSRWSVEAYMENKKFLFLSK